MKTEACLWFVVGSQHLYGPEAIRQVQANAEAVAGALRDATAISIPVVCKRVMTTPAEIRQLCQEANSDPNCTGVILWMHTFSPAKMWIGGLKLLQKPVLHLHTQFNRGLPWESIDMDFMNLNQAAHGDREAGHLHTRLGLRREVVVGHWSDPDVQQEIDEWARVAEAWMALQGARIARFGDNMRQVAVTEGDKVSAEATFGFSVDGFGVGDLAVHINAVSDTEVDKLVGQYLDSYEVLAELRPGGDRHEALREAARIECGLRGFLHAGDFVGFTTTFEDLHGLRQLPGIAVQRLMADGYGFGAEGDWKTCALLWFCKRLTSGLAGGTSFMEDYTYDMPGLDGRVLGAHMLEICPSIAGSRPKLEVHPLGIGGKEDPVRLVFDAPPGNAVNASLIDLGGRFRLVVNDVEAVEVPAMPALPVARALWKCKPDFKTALAAWIYAGGAHHTVYSYALRKKHLQILANLAGIEIAVIDEDTNLDRFRTDLKMGELLYR